MFSDKLSLRSRIILFQRQNFLHPRRGNPASREPSLPRLRDVLRDNLSKNIILARQKDFSKT
ncbi:hypothetical protein COS33_00925 [Candidatus Wolfebacteria bacterium CG02_land_8_20_14_3_00_37_12]|uniref:Uncharacterized protein n=1 Tax=Candidatus Wolfebacteria bacterium CG02_land_8_20_14_3_00_37_12 TaxID=1975066 RepID=A0A2M7CQB5_9BACT|nr:MAG: hypothetical protein COS33_00925 [Candidatus Wolfebacteria bacterium CG02_land_8_20_14_3_00_37_12]